jgi:uncharacterized glyoxalase superfamily protein PhnB
MIAARSEPYETQEVGMSDPAMLWPILVYRDARAASTFLHEAFGFEIRAMYEQDDDPSVVQHAELRWPLGGGVMVGTAGAGSAPFNELPTASNAVYVVTDDPDGLHDRAVAAGAEIVRGLNDQSYGSRDFTARDPEGVLWSFGTYRGE